MNSGCYRAAVPFIYSRLSIDVSRSKKLEQELGELTNNPLRRQCFKHVRRLELSGQIPSSRIAETKDLILSERDFHADYFFPLFMWTEEGDKSSPLWTRLMSLISQFQHLTDLKYTCNNRFPYCLLRAIHQHHPACRLDVHTYHSRGLGDLITNPRKLELIKSPCLHRLTIRCVMSARSGDLEDDVEDDHSEEYIRTILRSVGIAPNLRHLHLIGYILYITESEFEDRVASKRAAKKNFKPPGENLHLGALESLSFTGYQEVTKGKLQEWKKYANLSTLRSFSWSNITDPEVLIYASENLKFDSLETLEIYLGVWRPDENFMTAVGMFLDSLNPLIALRLYGVLDTSLLVRIGERHGNTLRELQFRGYGDWVFKKHEPHTKAFSFVDVMTIRDHCPLLEELHLRVQRFYSDRRETKCYKALSTFPRLVNLSLELDCSNPAARDLPPPEKIGKTKFDQQVFEKYLDREGNVVCNVHVRDALINAAIDENLARSIWDVITTTGTKPGGHPLRQLKITTCRGGWFGDTDLSETSRRFDYISQSFELTRSERDDRPQDVDIVETGKEEREEHEESIRRERALYGSLYDSRGSNSKKLERVFEKLWHPKPGSRDWRDDWSSKRLEMVDSEEDES